MREIVYSFLNYSTIIYILGILCVYLEKLHNIIICQVIWLHFIIVYTNNIGVFSRFVLYFIHSTYFTIYQFAKCVYRKYLCVCVCVLNSRAHILYNIKLQMNWIYILVIDIVYRNKVHYYIWREKCSFSSLSISLFLFHSNNFRHKPAYIGRNSTLVYKYVHCVLLYIYSYTDMSINIHVCISICTNNMSTNR